MKIWTVEVDKEKLVIDKRYERMKITKNTVIPMGVGELVLRKTKSGWLGIRKTSTNKVAYKIHMKKNNIYKLGPHYGHRVVEPSEERDPIKRVLREFGIPIRRLRKGAETERLVIHWKKGGLWKWNEGACQWTYFHDGAETVVDYREDNKTQFASEITKFIEISDYSYIIEVTERILMGGSIREDISQVIVRDVVEPEKLRKALAEISNT